MKKSHYSPPSARVSDRINGSAARVRSMIVGGLAALALAWTPSTAALAQPLDQIEASVIRAGALDKILEAGVVRIAVPSDLPPFGSRGPGGQVEGYDVEVAALIAKELGVRLQLVPVTSVDRIPALLTLRADIVVANLGVNPERAKSIAFSSPYAPFFAGVYGAPELAVKGPADLKGRKVAVTRDTIEDRALARLAPEGVEILKFDDNEATLNAFLAGRADLLATGNVVIAALMTKVPERKVESKFVLQKSPASIGVRRDEPGLLHWVNVFIYHKKLSGELDQLSRKWLGSPLPELPSL
jgi:polar amino acid transport system substrate-binding protein